MPCHVDDLGREAETRHRLAQHLRAAAKPATGRVLGVERDELQHELGHRVGVRLEPGEHIGGEVAVGRRQHVSNLRHGAGRPHASLMGAPVDEAGLAALSFVIADAAAATVDHGEGDPLDT